MSEHGRTELPRRPRKAAVALGYEPSRDAAPRVLAKGHGEVADEILRRAAEAGVPINPDTQLTHTLGKLDVGAAIPPEFYRVVAELIAYVYRMEQEMPSRKGKP